MVERLLRCGFKLLLTVSILVACTFADGSFDLVGPRVEVTVTRAGKVLPIAQVPNLQPGDRLWIHPAFPDTESVHYLLIVSFLRGATNPPPDNWFTKVETWTKPARQEGVVVTVPDQAQQAVLFLAPTMGGDFSTLRSAVQGKPGAFVRAAQDLNLASADRMRLDMYLTAIRDNSAKDPQELHDRSVQIAHSLGIKLDSQCFDKPSEQQAPCLMQNTDQLVLDDGHGQSMLNTLSTGPGADLLGAVTATKPGGAGAYSPYVGVIVDLARVFENIHTAQYQYIPALALAKKDSLHLKLNNPPSFHKPKSVMVVALPPVQKAKLPTLRAAETKQPYCAQKPSLALLTEAPPLVFATELAHDMVLSVPNKTGKTVDLPVRADAVHGGYSLAEPVAGDQFASELTGTLHGNWGFDPLDGPTFHLVNVSDAAHWTLPDPEEHSLIVGREDTLHMRSIAAACVEEVRFKDADAKPTKTSWKLSAPDEVELKVQLADVAPASAKIEVKQFGLATPVEVPVRTYSEAGRLDELSLHAGDREGVLKGARLDQVAVVEVGGARFTPAGLKRVEKQDELNLSSRDALASAFKAAQPLTAHVTLNDGRVLNLQTTVAPERPKVTLLSRKVQSAASPIRLGNSDDLPLDRVMTFTLQSDVPSTFPRDEKIEVASEDGSFHTTLTISDGTLSLQDSRTLVAQLDARKSFGDSAFGALQFRPVSADGTAGEWQPLAHLVRVPKLKEVRCPDTPEKPCTLRGEQLYLIDSIAADRDFAHPTPVPSGFTETQLTVPRPNGTLLYLKLRDDPSAVNTAVLPVIPAED